MNTSTIRLAIIDAHRNALDGAQAWFAGQSDIDVSIAEPRWQLFAEGYDRAGGAHVVVLDMSLQDGLPVLLKLPTLIMLGLKVVLLGDGADTALIREALRSGAVGYVDRRDGLEAFASAVRSAAAGETKKAAKARTDAPQPAHNLNLTTRERQVVAGVASGMPMHAVADSLHISLNTAQGYLKEVRRRSLAAGRDIGTVILVRKFAIEAGYVPSD